jgi:MFS family permease
MAGFGFTSFALATVGCALSTSIGELVAFRVFAGLGAAMLGVGAPAFVTRYVGITSRHSAFAALSATVSVAFILGPALGGIILSFASWPWLFWINLPLCAEGLFLTLYAHRLGLPELQEAHNGTSCSLGLGSIAPFACVASLGATSIIAFVTTAFELAPHFQPWEIGLALLCGPVGAVLMAHTAARLMSLGKHAKAMAIGTAVVAAASAVLIAVPKQAIVLVGALLLVYGAGNGLTSAPTTASVLALFPSSRHATASGLARTVNALAIAIAASGTGAVVARAGPSGAWLCSSVLALIVSAIVVVSNAGREPDPIFE